MSVEVLPERKRKPASGEGGSLRAGKGAKMERKRYAYDALLHEEPDGGAWVAFPWDLRAEFRKGRVKVRASFDGVHYEGSLVNMGVKNPDGSVCYVIGVKKAIRQTLGQRDGDMIHVEIREREDGNGPGYAAVF